LKGSIRIEFTGAIAQFDEVELMLKKYCHFINLSRFRLTNGPTTSPNANNDTIITSNDINEYEYTFKIKDIKLAPAMRDELASMKGVKINRMLFEDQVTTSNSY
jgi:hypothetical protein